MTSDCNCGYDGDWDVCFDGAHYGPCEYESCGGVCEYKGDCQCECHAGATEPRDLALIPREDTV